MSENDKQDSSNTGELHDGGDQSYQLERPSPHDTVELYQQANEARHHQDMAETNSTSQGLADGVKGVVDAQLKTSGCDEFADRWLLEKHGGFPYVEVEKVFDHHQDEMEQIAARAIENAAEHNRAFEHAQSSQHQEEAADERSRSEQVENDLANHFDAVHDRACQHEEGQSSESSHGQGFGNGHERN